MNKQTIRPDAAVHAVIAELVSRARTAQTQYEKADQGLVDDVVAAVGWAIMAPERNRQLAEIAVHDTGIGNVEDKLKKNYRKTLGLLRDLKGAKTVGIIAQYPDRGLIEIARPVGVVAAVTPSTNPAATPANKIINALKCRNAIIVAPSPKGWSTCSLLLEFIYRELRKVGVPSHLVQMLPAPVTKEMTWELMRQADLVVATGSQANVRMASTCGTPAFGVGVGNVVSIVDSTADVNVAAQKIAQSKTFDNATSCSSENSIVLLAPVYGAMLQALEAMGGVVLDAAEKQTLQDVMWRDGKLTGAIAGQSATAIAEVAELPRVASRRPRFLMVEESGYGRNYPFSGEKLSPVLAIYRANNFDDACEIARKIYAYMGAGHSVGLHSRDESQAMSLGLKLPVSRVIVNQAHCIAAGGSFENGLPFSLSMGCGTWGRNTFSDNMNYRHYMNVTRIVKPIPEQTPSEAEILGEYFRKYGK